jgi:hypothetical protein
LEILKEQGFEVEHHALPTSHNLTYNDVELAKVWLEKYFLSTRSKILGVAMQRLNLTIPKLI